MENGVLVEIILSGVLKHFTCAHDDTFFLIYSRPRVIFVSSFVFYSGGPYVTRSIPSARVIFGLSFVSCSGGPYVTRSVA